MRDVILAQLEAARAAFGLVRVAIEQGDQKTLEREFAPTAIKAAVAALDAAAALISAWGNLDDSLAPDGQQGAGDGICRHEPEKRISTATHGDPKAWLCRECGFNGTDSATERQA